MSNFINTTGYLNDSPHKNNPFNIIKSKVITMNNVDIPLLLRPNKGKSVIAMPNSGEYNFPKADYVFEKPLFQPGGAFNDCPEGFTWSVADQQCLPIDQAQVSNFSGNRNSFITGAINPSGQRVGGVGAQAINQGNTAIDENQNAKLKRVFGTPNIPAIAASNLLGYGLATFANNMEQGRQKAFMMKQMNNPLFNGSYSNAQNDYGVDPYEQTGQLRQQFQKGGEKKPIIVNDKNDPRLRAYNDSLNLYNANNLYNQEALNILKTSKTDGEYSTRMGFNIGNIPTPTGILGKANNEINKILNNHRKWQPISNIDPGYKIWPDGTKRYLLNTLEYKKPVQPVVFQKQPEEKKLGKPSAIPRQALNFGIGSRPTPDAPPNFQVAQFDNTKPTKYSFSYPTGKYNEQDTIYFPDAGSWKEFISNQKLISSEEGKGYGTATGNLKFQKGGSFNPIEYLYGDDDKEQIQKQEAIIAKKPRITEEDVDNSNEELKMLGLSEEDILGMVRPERIRRQNYQADSGVSTPSNVNPLVLKTQKDIFNQFSDVTNLGILGDKAHQKRKSDHNTGDAQDFGIKDIESGNAIANKLIAEAKERGVKYIVFNKKIWNPSISNEWRPYKGSNPHKTHVHVSYNKDLKMFEQGGEYVVDFATMKELQSKGIKFKIL